MLHVVIPGYPIARSIAFSVKIVLAFIAPEYSARQLSKRTRWATKFSDRSKWKSSRDLLRFVPDTSNQFQALQYMPAEDVIADALHASPFLQWWGA